MAPFSENSDIFSRRGEKQPGQGAQRPKRDANGAPAVLSAAPNAISLLKALQRRWVMACLLGGICALCAAAATWLFLPPPKHTVRTLLRVPPGTPFLFKTAEPIPDLGTHQRNQAAMIKSRLVLNSALRAPEVSKLPVVNNQADAITWLEREVQADFSVAPEVLRIVMNGQNPEELVPLVNAIRTSYLKEVVDKDRSMRRARLAKLGELRAKYDEQIQANRETQKKLEEKVGSKDAGVRSRMLLFALQQLGMNEQELIKTQSELRKARLELDTLKATEKQIDNLTIPESAISEALAKERDSQELFGKIKTIETLIGQQLELAARGENEPSIRTYRSQLATLQRDLKMKQAQSRPEVIRRLQDKARANLAANLAIGQGRARSLEATDQMLETVVQGLRKSVVDLSKQGLKLDAFHEDMSHIVDLTKRFLAEEHALMVELEAPERIQVLEEATVIYTDAMKRRLMMTGGAGLGVLVLILLIVGWLEYQARRVDMVEEVVGGLGMRLVGAIPKAPPALTGLSGKGLAETLNQDVFAESIDTTRAMVLHLARKDSLRVVLVTSAVGREGKTTLACRLAVSMARAGLRTLLIDGDMRNPSVHRFFDVPAEVGFAQVVCGTIEIAAATHQTSINGLEIIPAGEWDEQTLRALSQRQAGPILDQLRDQYDCILIDSSPVLPVADALLIGQHVDGALISVRRHVSRMPKVYTASQRIEAMGIRILGVVMSGVQEEVYTSTYTHLKAATVES